MILEIFSQVIPWHIPHPSINFFDPGPKNKNVYFFQIFEKKAQILENLNNWFRLMIYGMSTHLYVWMPCHIGYIDMVSPQYESSCDNKASFLNKSLVTLAALIWSLPSVYGYLTCKMLFPWEILLTLGALIWFLPSVSHHVFCKSTFMCECLVTLVTWIWFFHSMCPHVFFKVTIFWKSLIPLAALVWFITSMSPQINSELNIPLENPAESMYQHMLPRAASNVIQNSTVSFTQISLP